MSDTVTITIAVAVLAAFLVLLTVLKYAIRENFTRTRLIMTAFFCFIVFTLTLAFWRYTLDSLPYTIPAALLGAFLGHFLGVRTERQKLAARGVHWYREHFAHVHIMDLRELTWWSVINFYSVMGALLLINLVGLSSVIFRGHEPLALATCIVGAFLLGTIAPYLLHLWGVTAADER